MSKKMLTGRFNLFGHCEGGAIKSVTGLLLRLGSSELEWLCVSLCSEQRSREDML